MNVVDKVMKLEKLRSNHHNMRALCEALIKHGHVKKSQEIRKLMWRIEDMTESTLIGPGMEILYADVRESRKASPKPKRTSRPKKRKASVSRPRNVKRRRKA